MIFRAVAIMSFIVPYSIPVFDMVFWSASSEYLGLGKQQMNMFRHDDIADYREAVALAHQFEDSVDEIFALRLRETAGDGSNSR